MRLTLYQIISLELEPAAQLSLAVMGRFPELRKYRRKFMSYLKPRTPRVIFRMVGISLVSWNNLQPNQDLQPPYNKSSSLFMT